MPTLALVALSARAMAQAAAHDGFGVVSIDLFGDLDTRRASLKWLPAGQPGTLRIDPAWVLRHLRELAQGGAVDGWVAGSGCEGLPDLLAAGAALLPLIGTAPAAMRRVRDPATFFAWLDEHGIGHPEVRVSAPAEPGAWLVKDATACGGGHVRPASSSASGAVSAGQYFQRRVAGTPMSATFCANGADAVVLGFNEGLLREGGHGFGYAGVLGPVALPAAAAGQATRALRLLAAGMHLRGLGSLDFMLEGEHISVLEVNPRPSASLALYAQTLAGGVMAAHVQACLHQRLPPPSANPAGPSAVRGEAVVFAPGGFRLPAAAAAALQARPDCHDLPAAATPFAPGDPLCSVSADAPDAASVRLRLRQRHDEVLNILEHCT
jgi:uncharacterized protein